MGSSSFFFLVRFPDLVSCFLWRFGGFWYYVVCGWYVVLPCLVDEVLGSRAGVSRERWVRGKEKHGMYVCRQNGVEWGVSGEREGRGKGRE